MVNSITAAQTHIPRSARVSMHFLPSPASKFGLKVPRATFISRCSILQWEHELRNQEPTADESIPRFTRSSCSPIWSFAVCEQRAKPDSYSTSVCKTVTTSAILRTFSRAVVCDLRKRAVHPWSLIFIPLYTLNCPCRCRMTVYSKQTAGTRVGSTLYHCSTTRTPGSPAMATISDR